MGVVGVGQAVAQGSLSYYGIVEFLDGDTAPLVLVRSSGAYQDRVMWWVPRLVEPVAVSVPARWWMPRWAPDGSGVYVLRKRADSLPPEVVFLSFPGWKDSVVFVGDSVRKPWAVNFWRAPRSGEPRLIIELWSVFPDSVDCGLFWLREGKRLEMVVDSPGSIEWQGAFSPDGRWVAFLSNRNRPDTVRHILGVYDLYVMPLTGSLRRWRRLTTHGQAIKAVSWTPDGRRLLYYRIDNRRREYGMSILDFSGKPDTFFLPRAYWVAWSPSGRYIAYRDEREGHWGIWIMDLESGRRLRLTAALDNYPDWCRSCAKPAGSR